MRKSMTNHVQQLQNLPFFKAAFAHGKLWACKGSA